MRYDNQVTQLLDEARGGDAEAARELLPLVYGELRRIAQQRMNEQRPDHTLQATALVHEAYVRLVGEREIHWENRAHFFFASARAMQDILIEHARAKARLKRGGDGQAKAQDCLPLNVADLADEIDPDAILELHEALQRLEREQPDVADVVRLRFFAGLTCEQTAAALHTSARQVRRTWSYSRAWLFRAVEEQRG